MNQRSHLTLVQADDLPPPMLPDDVDLRGMDAVLVEREWLTSVENRIEMGPEAMVAALTLQQASIDQKPSGSLPSDDTKLGYLALYGSHTAGWLAVKDRALRDWVLCSDGRYYSRTICIRILDSWIKCINSREKSDAGNSAKNKVDFDPTLYVKARARAEAALAQIDPFAPILRKSKAKTRAAVATGAVATPTGTPTGRPPSSPSGVPNGTERNGTDSSSPLCGDDSRTDEKSDREEVGQQRQTAAAGCPENSPPELIPPWPADWLARFKARYPRKKSWGAAERVLQRFRKTGNVAFETIMAGVERLIASGGDPQFVPYPATWLAARGWEDEPDPAPRGPGGRVPNRTPGNNRVALATNLLERFHDAAR